LGVEASSVYSLLPVYDVNTDTTSIGAASANFNSGMVGMAFYPDSTQPMISEYSPSRFEPAHFLEN